MRAVEAGLVDDADEELRAAAVGLPGDDDGGDRAPDVARVAELGRHEAEPAAPVVGGPVRIGGDGVAALHDAVAHHPVEGGAVERSVRRELHHEADVVGREVGPQIDRDRAEVGSEHGLLAGHLLDRQRGDERLAVLRGREWRDGEPDEQGASDGGKGSQGNRSHAGRRPPRLSMPAARGNGSQGNGSHGSTSQWLQTR